MKLRLGASVGWRSREEVLVDHCVCSYKSPIHPIQSVTMATENDMLWTSQRKQHKQLVNQSHEPAPLELGSEREAWKCPGRRECSC